MQEIPKYYATLFNAMTDAVQAIELCNYGQARRLLLRAQQAAEEEYLAGEEPHGQEA